LPPPYGGEFYGYGRIKLQLKTRLPAGFVRGEDLIPRERTGLAVQYGRL